MYIGLEALAKGLLRINTYARERCEGTEGQRSSKRACICCLNRYYDNLGPLLWHELAAADPGQGRGLGTVAAGCENRQSGHLSGTGKARTLSELRGCEPLAGSLLTRWSVLGGRATGGMPLQAAEFRNSGVRREPAGPVGCWRYRYPCFDPDRRMSV